MYVNIIDLNSITMPTFSNRINNLKSSPIRDILKVIDRPEMISFAGGLPSADSFPQPASLIPTKYLQYGPSEGEPELRQLVREILHGRGLTCNNEQILILSGSQQGIDLSAKLFIDPGICIALESPTYLAALQVYQYYGAKLVDIADSSASPVLTYVNPTFQNPTGHCYSEEERLQVAKNCTVNRSVLFEDDPYHDLVFDEVCRTPICSMLDDAPWIYQGSFSKSFAPGLRLGFVAASDDLIPYLTQLKQAADLHSNRVSQYFVSQWLQDDDYHGRLKRLAKHYTEKRNHFGQLLADYFSDIASWKVPAGGLFFWLKLNNDVACNTQELLPKAITQGVAFMPGEPFFHETSNQSRYLRLNFSNATPEQAIIGLKKLARLIKQ